MALAGETDPVIGPADVTISDGKNTIVYAWGSAEDDNLKLAVQTVATGHSDPHGVNAGEAGLAADPAWSGWLMGLALLGVIVGAGRLVQVRAAARR